MPHRIDTNDLIDDLQIVADALGREPTWQEYDDHGEYSAQTIANRFDGWRNALSEIEIDNPQQPAGTRLRLLCRNCREEFRKTTRPSATVNCSHCGATNTPLEAKIRWQAENATIYPGLAQGPMTPDDDTEIDSGIKYTGVEKLSIPATARPTDVPGISSSERTPVYYLPGDLRRAMDLFIEENSTYVTANVEGPYNHCKIQWSDELWQVLVEQYYFNSHIDGEEIDVTEGEMVTYLTEDQSSEIGTIDRGEVIAVNGDEVTVRKIPEGWMVSIDQEQVVTEDELEVSE